jgi:hypothetical protein
MRMEDIETGRWHRLRRLLDRAIDLDVRARGAWLGALDGEDKALRPQLEALLARHDVLKERTLSTAIGLLTLALAGNSSAEADVTARNAGETADSCTPTASEHDDDGIVRRWLYAEHLVTSK